MHMTTFLSIHKAKLAKFPEHGIDYWTINSLWLYRGCTLFPDGELLHQIHVTLILTRSMIHAVAQLMIESRASTGVSAREQVSCVSISHWHLWAWITLLIKQYVRLLSLSFHRGEVWTNKLYIVIIVSVPETSVLVLDEGIVVALVSRVTFVHYQWVKVVHVRFFSLPVCIWYIYLVIIVQHCTATH